MFMKELDLKTEPKNFYNITRDVEEIVSVSGIKEGLCILFTPSTTGFVFLQEDCDLLKEDFKKVFEKIASEKEIFAHPDNAHSHIITSFLSGQRIIPIKDGKLLRGTWQEILFYEADTRPRNRKVYVILVPL